MLVGIGAQGWTALAGVGGAAIGSLATIASQFLGNSGAEERERRVDRRRLRDAKAERARAQYESVARVATAFQSIAGEQTYVMEGESREERDARLQTRLTNATVDFERVWTAVLLEPGAEEVRDSFDEAGRAFSRLQSSRAINAIDHGAVKTEQIDAEVDALKTAVDNVVIVAKRHLEELGTPM